MGEYAGAHRGLVPGAGDGFVAASALINKGNMVGQKANGFLMQGDTKANGCTKILGRSTAKYDNSLGIDGAKSAHYELGNFEWINSATDPVAQADLWNVVFTEDGATVAKTDNGGTLVTAGILTEITAEGKAVVFMAPWVADFAQASASTAGGSSTVQKRSVVVPKASLTAVATTQAINIGAVLPANARIVGAEFYALTPFAGGSVSAVSVAIGTAADASAIVSAADVFAAAVDGQSNTQTKGKAPSKLFAAAGAQLQALFTATGGNLSTLTAGTVTIDVLYVVLP